MRETSNKDTRILRESWQHYGSQDALNNETREKPI